MKQSKFPRGWDVHRSKEVLAHYETQSEEEAVAEDEAAFNSPGQTVMEIPTDLVPAVRELIQAPNRIIAGHIAVMNLYS